MIAGSVYVLRAGLQTTVQDEGRWGYQSRGVPVAGPMDPFSHRLANALAGNPRSAAVLEVSLTGPELEFDDERVVAVAGAVFSLSVDGEVPHERPFVGAHGRLAGARVAGARAVHAEAPIRRRSAAGQPTLRRRIGGWQGALKGIVFLGPPLPVRLRSFLAMSA